MRLKNRNPPIEEITCSPKCLSTFNNRRVNILAADDQQISKRTSPKLDKYYWDLLSLQKFKESIHSLIVNTYVEGIMILVLISPFMWSKRIANIYHSGI